MQAVREYLQELEAGKQARPPAMAGPLPRSGEPLAPMPGGLGHSAPGGAAGPARSRAIHRGRRAANPAANPLGDFQIVREIGRGGMGIVYEAIQLSLGRRVAMKVLPFAATFDAKQLQRFRQEAQAAAQLHHTNIVPVYAMGCERGIHFYAMQLIEGQSLDVVMRPTANRRAWARDRGRQPIRRRWAGPESSASRSIRRPAIDSHRAGRCTKLLDFLRRFVPTRSTGFRRIFPRFTAGDGGPFRFAARSMAQAAEALEYAHQQGIIHRDIKPANLLIDVRGNVWITDFGLAHFRVDSGLTQTGDLLGTVRYMSPEQASGQRVVLDHRTDVYSLGATFYEVLTLQPVFARQTRGKAC